MKFIYFILRKIGNAGPCFKHLDRVNFILKGKIHSFWIQFKMMDIYAPCYIRTNARRVELKFIIRAPFRFKKKKISTRLPFLGVGQKTIWFVPHRRPLKSLQIQQFNVIRLFFLKKIFIQIKSPRWDLVL